MQILPVLLLVSALIGAPPSPGAPSHGAAIVPSTGLPAARSDRPARVQAELRRRVATLRAGSSLVLDGAVIHASEALMGAYERSGYALLWADPRAAAALLELVRAAGHDGLDPDDYHRAPLEAAAAARVRPVAAGRAAELDLLRSDALLRLAYHLRHGKLDRASLRPVWRFDDALNGVDARDVLRTLSASAAAPGGLAAAIDALRPAHFSYRELARALAALERSAAAGGWDAIAAGPSLRLGDAGERVVALRRRLHAGGDLDAAAPPAADSSLFDDALDHAVRRFQHRHALNEDGVVGARTLAELNVPAAARIDQVRVNLERARWIVPGLDDRFVAVNVAGARVYMVVAGAVVFESRVIVGRHGTETPIFDATMRTIELNPTWTVPPGIVGEILAEIRRDRGYLARENMRVLDRAGRAVDPASIDFGRYTARSFPYTFRQEPGPRNALGRIKLLFPNVHHVYLHDTPARALFDREERLFSHGCIRVHDPVGLAAIVLGDARWSRDALEAAIATGATRTITLARPLPVRVLYWTASADLHGELHFYRDVYARDAPVLGGLRARAARTGNPD